jgi:hypothetical protein
MSEVKTCVRCGEMPFDLEHWRPHKRPGGRVSWDCRKCANDAARRAERKALADPEKGPAYRARRAAWAREHRAKYPERYAAATRRYYERMMATPEGRAEVIVSKRISRRLRAEREGRVYANPKRATVEPYRQVAHGKGSEVVPAGPIMAYLERTFPGWKPGEIATFIRNAVSGRLVYHLLVERPVNVELDAVDRLVTLGLGRPDLLLVLYPLEGS